MNLIVSLLISAEQARLIEGLKLLLPAEGRPIFSDDIDPKWQDVYQHIELLSPPNELKALDEYLMMRWYETNYSASTLVDVFKQAGADILLAHSIEGDPAAADEGSGEDSEEGYYYLLNEGKLVSLTASNIHSLLPGLVIKWSEDVVVNFDRIAYYISKTNHL